MCRSRLIGLPLYYCFCFTIKMQNVLWMLISSTLLKYLGWLCEAVSLHDVMETIFCHSAPHCIIANSRITALPANPQVNWPSWSAILMHSRCFSLCPSASHVCSTTQLPIQQQLLIASLKLLGIILLELLHGLFFSSYYHTMQHWCSGTCLLMQQPLVALLSAGQWSPFTRLDSSICLEQKKYLLFWGWSRGKLEIMLCLCEYFLIKSDVPHPLLDSAFCFCSFNHV